MQLTYKPAGDEKNHRAWDLDAGKLMNVECEMIERVSGFTFDEWAARVENGSTICIRAFIWVMLKREQPTLKFSEVAFMRNEVGLVASDDEILEIEAKVKARIESGDAVPPEMEIAYEQVKEQADEIRAKRAEQADIDAAAQESRDADRDALGVVQGDESDGQHADRDSGDQGKATPPLVTSGDGTSPSTFTAPPQSSTA